MNILLCKSSFLYLFKRCARFLKKTPREFSGGYYMCHDVFCRKPCISWQLLTEAKPTKKYSKMSDSV